MEQINEVCRSFIRKSTVWNSSQFKCIGVTLEANVAAYMVYMVVVMVRDGCPQVAHRLNSSILYTLAFRWFFRLLIRATDIVLAEDKDK